MNVSRNPREYWRFIKQSCSKNSNIGDKVSSETFVNYFKNLLNMEVTTENENLLQNIVQENDSNDLERPITNEEISSSIKSIHSNRSPVLRNGLNRAYCRVSARLKCHF